ILFFLARHDGRPFILHLVSEKSYEKYMKWTANQKNYNWISGLCIIAPIAPDDILCMIAGLTEVMFTTYLWIILLGKHWNMAAYSLGLVYGAKWLVKLVGK